MVERAFKKHLPLSLDHYLGCFLTVMALRLGASLMFESLVYAVKRA